MNVTDTLLTLFDTSNRLDILYKKAFGDILINYTFTEMHCIDFIGKTENPNVTKIAQSMKLTKAAISKIIKKLLAKNAVKTYKNSDNKKETYYKLTKIGQEVFEKHQNMHKMWYEKDEAFFNLFNKEDLDKTLEILEKYTQFLDERIKTIKEDLK